MSTLQLIPKLLLSSISVATDKETLVRVMNVAERAINRLPEKDSAFLPGIVESYNAAYLGSVAITCRIEGDIHYALRCEGARDRLLESYGF